MAAAADRPLFIAHDKLTQWEGEGKVSVQGAVLTLIAEKRSYALVEAVRFLRVVGEEPDPHTLIGKVRNKDQLKTLGAEHMMGSVILGDTAYEVQEGFVGTVINTGPRPVTTSPPPRPTAPPPPARPAAPPPPVTPPAAATAPAKSAPSISDALGGSSTKSAPSDAELLANFLLDNLAG